MLVRTLTELHFDIKNVSTHDNVLESVLEVAVDLVREGGVEPATFVVNHLDFKNLNIGVQDSTVLVNKALEHYKTILGRGVELKKIELHPSHISVFAYEVEEEWNTEVSHTTYVHRIIEALCDSIPEGVQFEKDEYVYRSPEDFFQTLQGESPELIKRLLKAFKIEYREYSLEDLIRSTNNGSDNYSRSYLIQAKELAVQV